MSERVPRTSQSAAVEQWSDAVEFLDDGDDADVIRNANIHDRQDRRDIEEIIDHGDINDDAALALEDAFDDLRTEFGW